MLVSDILRNKSGDVITGAAGDTVAEIAARLAAHRIGAVPVTGDDGGVLGILSERDIVRGLAEHGTGCLKLKAADLMTSKVISCAADDTIKHVMQVMTENRIRHLPIMAGGALKDIITIGDVVKHRLEEQQHEVEELHRYVSGG